MREKIKKIKAYIFRSREDEPVYTHPPLKVLPPFFFKLIAILIVIQLLIVIIKYIC
jgi:Ni,Fe-hydrogenase I cytochrome b subunit